MNPIVFREYDIRGIVGKELLVENIYDLTKAIITFFLNSKPTVQTIAVGMDGRLHSKQIKEQVTAAILNFGLDVIDIGLCPTPLMYFSLFQHSADAGLIITASHNPKEYNGIKICLDKKSVWGSQIQQIRKIYELKNFNQTSAKPGNIKQLDIVESYINWVLKNFPHLIKSNISAIIDCGNGTAGAVLPKLVSAMQWKNVSLIFEQIDGNFPNHEPDPTVEKNIKDLAFSVSQKPKTIGIGLDGDCDRMAAIAENGYLIPGDKLLSIFSKQILEENPGAPIVFDIKSSSGLIDVLNSQGGKGCISPSGHSIIKEQMFINKALLAGELSCHFFFNDRYFGYDDGIYAMLRLFEILQKTSKTLEELVATFPKKYSSPEFRIGCKESDKELIVRKVRNFFEMKIPKELITIDGVRAHMDYGWGLVRASNTQSVICLLFEADTTAGLNKIQDDFLEALSNFFDTKELRKEITRN